MNIIFLAQALSFLIPESNSTEAREYKIELVAKLKKIGFKCQKSSCDFRTSKQLI